MVFICSLAFATFTVDLDLPQNRLQLTFILLLTTVTFKFVVSQTLPRISYLTYLDKYILISMAMLCVVCAWHAAIPHIKSHTSSAAVADQCVLVTLAAFYVLFHIVLFLNIYIVALKKSWRYSEKDRIHKERMKATERPEKDVKSQANHSTDSDLR